MIRTPTSSPPASPPRTHFLNSPQESATSHHRPSTSSSAIIPEDERSFRFLPNYGKFFALRMVQALVQARQNENLQYDQPCDPSPSSIWFNLQLDELGEVSAQIKRSVTSFPPSIPALSVDFILYTVDGETLPLETWTFSYAESTNKSSIDRSEIATANTKSRVYHELSVLLRSVMVAARMTPMHRYYVKKQSAETFVITYRVVEGRSSVDLGEDSKKRQIGEIRTPVGSFFLQLFTRTRFEIDRAATPGSAESFQQVQITPGTSPADALMAAKNSAPVAAGGNAATAGTPVGTPSSFCDVLSQFSSSPMSVATSPPSGGFSATSPATMRRQMQEARQVRTRTFSEMTSDASSGGAGTTPSSGKVATSPPDIIDEEEMIRSQMRAAVAPDVPFANLLLSSYTGILKANNVGGEETEQQLFDRCRVPAEEAERERKEAEEEFRQEHPQELTEEADSTASTSPPTFAAVAAAISTTTTVTSSQRTVRAEEEEEGGDGEKSTTNTIREEGRDPEGESGEEDEEDELSKELGALEVGIPVLPPPLGSLSSQRHPSGGTESGADGDLEDEEGEESFVEVANFGSSQHGDELTAFISRLKRARPGDIIGREEEIDGERLQRQLSQFASHQGAFDRMLAVVRDSVEEEERAERAAAAATANAAAIAPPTTATTAP